MDKSKKAIERSFMDDMLLDAAYQDLAAVVTGKSSFNTYFSNDDRTARAIGDILAFYHQVPLEIPQGKDPIAYITQMRNISTRIVRLEGEWYKDAIGPYLGETIDGKVVALLPKRGRYYYFDEDCNKSVRITRKTAGRLKPDALMFYIPLPVGKIGVKDLYGYMLRALTVWDGIVLVGATLLASVIAMTTPAMTKLVFAGLIPSQSRQLVLPVLFLLIFSMLSTHIVNILRTLTVGVVNVRAGYALQAAAMNRVMTMPADFFRKHAPGEIAMQLNSIDKFASNTVSAVFSSGLTGLFSLIFVVQIFAYAPELVIPAIIVLLLKMSLAFVCVIISVKRANLQLKKQGKLAGFMLTIINGIQKIRLSGAEKRIFAKWARQYKEVAELNYRMPKLLLYKQGILNLISVLGLVVIYYIASASRVSMANYMAFNSAYGMVSGAFTALIGIVSIVADFGPLMNLMKPILDTEPELEPGKTVPESITGKIAINHVSFRYQMESPMLLDDISLEIEAGEYVAIVGATGSGKSTLMRLLLGFEKPEQGAIYYDDQDLHTLSLQGIRRKIGAVLQNGQLLQGSIFSNLSITKPDMTEEEAWDALEKAGLAGDVQRMPMKLNTMLGENGAGISGGQRQRLMIARALVGNPKVVFLDEATSALDNVMQAHVVRALDALDCTRIVIAHRLSTIQNCSRIVVLDNGKIVEDGTYSQLLAQKGKFAELVERQRVDTGLVG